ncbi:MAG: DUF3142 domain-containing protein [Terracidiphilus sp.]
MFLLALVCLGVRSDIGPRARLSAQMGRLPALTLWAWERPEDLTSIDPATTAVAYLDRTILVGDGVLCRPRRQPLTVPGGTTRIAVVRIEALPSARLDDAQTTRVLDLLLESARRPGIAALQVDFDATRSQRRFYAGLLRELRRRMPAGLPLSITALASWCSNDDWIAALPVDEAVPMFFRMEPGRRQKAPDAPEMQVREPLCTGSAGVSTREDWPEGLAGKRVYVFADRGWHDDLELLRSRELKEKGNGI